MLFWSVIWCMGLMDGGVCLLVMGYLCLGIPAVFLGYRVVWLVPIIIGGYVLVFVMGLVLGVGWVVVAMLSGGSVLLLYGIAMSRWFSIDI